MDSSPASPTDAFPIRKRVRVLLPQPLPGLGAGPLDYAASASLPAGTFVSAPLRNRLLPGVVWDGEPEGAEAIDEAKLKEIQGLLPVPPLPAVSRRFIDWVAAYTMTTPGAVLRMVLSVPDALAPPPSRRLWRWTEIPGLKSSPGRARIAALLADGRAMTMHDIATEAAVSPSVARGLAESGVLLPVDVAQEIDSPRIPLDNPGPTLSPDQAAGAGELVARLGAGFSVTHLAGVTGSGKTEVYFEAIAASLAEGGQVLVLLPEIALSAQWFQRFEGRFGAAPALWHSEITAKKRRETWRAVARGAAQVVVGARSALFLPFPDLKLIVVDEEHDGSFKQEDGVSYHARDMAVVRARLGAIPIVLASATPSLETDVNVRKGRYRRVDLPDRHGGAAMPTIGVIDLRADPPPRGRFISPSLAEATRRTLEAGEQAMLFINRRGYAPLTLCRKCGHRFQCPNCTAWLVEHRQRRRLVCHHCGVTAPIPKICPACHAEDSLAPCGPGVERLMEEATALFPEARTAMIASDVIAGPTAAAELIGRMERREIDLLIGTQMIAKGFHFPHLTLVGVIDADLGLSGGDLRAGERSWQLLHQVSGRAGRAAKPGLVLLQTAQPHHPVIAALAAGDGARFLAAEADEREAMAMPPFGRLAALIISSPDAQAAEAVARALGRCAPRRPDVTILGPVPAPLALLRGRHRHRLLIKAAKGAPVQTILREWLDRLPPQRGAAVRIAIDVDPYSFL